MEEVCGTKTDRIDGATVFHVGKPDLPLPMILKPGRWGERTRQFRVGVMPSTTQDLATLTRETCLEFARQTFAPQKPSRLCCIFSCLYLEDARVFRDKHQQGSAIYEARLLGSKAIHYGSFDLLIAEGATGAYLDFWIDRAKRYWKETSADGHLREIVYGGSIRLLRTVA